MHESRAHVHRIAPYGRSWQGRGARVLHVRAMLKRHGVHFRPLPKRRCPASRGNDRELSPSVIAWLRAADPSQRERAALEHFALAGERAHPCCGPCQEAIRARLQRRSLQRRSVSGAPCENGGGELRERRWWRRRAAQTVAASTTPTGAPAAGAPLAPSGASTPAFAEADSSVFSPWPGSEHSRQASSISSDTTLPGTAGVSSEQAKNSKALYWADVGRAAWEEYWDTRSDISASTASKDSGR